MRFGFTNDRIGLNQVVDQRLAVAAGHRVIDVTLTAQLDGHRKTAERNLEVFAEAFLQLPPQQREAFVERLAAGIGGQQARLGFDVTRQWFDLRPRFWRGVEVHHRFEIAVQVQHHVGIAGQPLQGQALGLQLRAGGLAGEGVAQMCADQFEVVLRIVAELALDGVADFFAEVDEPAIEVLPALQFVATQRHVHQHLFEADRVGHRHQHDLAAQAAGGFQLRQTLLEVPGDEHARQFVGMQ